MRHTGEVSFESVYAAHLGALYSFFYYKVLDKQITEDLVSKIFVEFSGTYDTHAADVKVIEHTLYGIACKQWHEYVAEHHNALDNTHIPADMFQTYVHNENAAISAITNEQRAKLYVDLLPPRQRIIATFRLVDGLTPQQISAKINKTTDYVQKSLLRIARQLSELAVQTRFSEAKQ